MRIKYTSICCGKTLLFPSKISSGSLVSFSAAWILNTLTDAYLLFRKGVKVQIYLYSLQHALAHIYHLNEGWERGGVDVQILRRIVIVTIRFSSSFLAPSFCFGIIITVAKARQVAVLATNVARTAKQIHHRDSYLNLSCSFLSNSYHCLWLWLQPRTKQRQQQPLR